MNLKKQIQFMCAAIEVGRKALPACLPNPPVGCVVVKGEKIIATGYTNKPGGNHAEAMALASVSEDTTDLILFVTLEPCSFFGRTPSCAKLIARRNVTEIYVGIIDPHSKNQGVGIAILEQAGIKVQVGLLEEIIQKELNPYLRVPKV